jgi:hypothetical protein
MAASKSVSRKSAANKVRKSRKPRAAAKKAAAIPKRRTAAKKTLATRKTKAPMAIRAKTNVDTPLPRRRMPEGSLTIAEIDDRIAIARNNLRDLVEQAASYSGASNEELMSQRIAEQEAKLKLLKKQHEELSQAITT